MAEEKELLYTKDFITKVVNSLSPIPLKFKGTISKNEPLPNVASVGDIYFVEDKRPECETSTGSIIIAVGTSETETFDKSIWSIHETEINEDNMKKKEEENQKKKLLIIMPLSYFFYEVMYSLDRVFTIPKWFINERNSIIESSFKNFDDHYELLNLELEKYTEEESRTFSEYITKRKELIEEADIIFFPNSPVDYEMKNCLERCVYSYIPDDHIIIDEKNTKLLEYLGRYR